MPEIRNTAAAMRDPTNAALFLLEQLASPNPADPSAQIERMEKAGQRELVNSDRLPTSVHDEGGDAPYLALGFTFGDADPNDTLFRPATLPPGWSRKPTDHSMWSKLVDEYGRDRCSIFYKAAFYDRSADMRLNSHCNYLMTVLYEKGTPVFDDAARADRDADKAAKFATEVVDGDTYWAERANEHRAAAAAARKMAEGLVAS